LGYLFWVGRQQKRSIVARHRFDTVWLLGLALLPWAVGNAIDQGILPGRFDRLAQKRLPAFVLVRTGGG